MKSNPAIASPANASRKAVQESVRYWDYLAFKVVDPKRRNSSSSSARSTCSCGSLMKDRTRQIYKWVRLPSDQSLALGCAVKLLRWKLSESGLNHNAPLIKGRKATNADANQGRRTMTYHGGTVQHKHAEVSPKPSEGISEFSDLVSQSVSE